jgi:hypothetical protein
MDDDVNPAAHAAERAYEPAPVFRPEHAESTLTRLVEQQSAKVPSHLFLFAAFGAMGFSAAAELSGHRRLARFVGMWPTPLLVMGVYNKLVKTLGAR